MDFHRFSVALLQLCFLFVIGCADISINCGSSGTAAEVNGRAWIGDVQPEFSLSVKLRGSSKSSIVIQKKLISARGEGRIPYTTARISRLRFSYEFHLNRGQKIVRLHFNPAPYKGFKGLVDLFTVEAADFTLISNFSASHTAQARGVNSFFKEFYLSIKENQSLSINISPASVDTYAFINGIEIISLPSGVSYLSNGEENGLQVVGQKSLVSIDETTALEMIHRQNIRHDSVDGFYDMFGLGDTVIPSWEDAMINNVTWKTPVDVGFQYLIRIHFCSLGLKTVETSGVVVEVLVNGMIAYTSTEIIRKTDGNGNPPGYRDYVLTMKGNKQKRKRNLLILLQFSEEFIDGHGPLKGFEIFKLSNPDNSLATPNPLPIESGAHRSIHNLLAIIGNGNMVAASVITALLVGNIVVHLLQQIWGARHTEEENMHVPSARAKGRCQRFSLAEIHLVTRNFSDGLLIGKGGFGKVYKGLMGEETVAVKRLKSNSQQGAREFLIEIETLSDLRHVNLVSLIGYCSEQREMILVYEYIKCGALADHLHKLTKGSDNAPSLTWEQRLNICIGASRGLDYLHTGNSLIHRDVKSSNILLDENFIAKVSDLGLARQENRSKLQSHVSTNVKGTRGYLDPYYFSTHKLTRKSDTYAFGVVLLEILCERPAVDFDLPFDEQILTKWAQKNIGEGKINEIVSSSLRGEISEDSLKAFVAVAERCLQDEPKKRPTMAQVVLQLESVLEQQDNMGSLVLTRITNDAKNISRDLTVNTKQQGMASSDEQTVTTHLQEQTNINVDDAEPSSGIKSRNNKPFKFWPWEAFWNRVKPSKQIEFVISDAHLTKFNWETIVAATSRFSPSAQCGSGSVYKGVLSNGQIVAISRFSPSIHYDNKRFINEVLLTGKLRHRNITRLLGYCIHKEKRFIVFEFVENGSLYTFMTAHRGQLEWPVRFKIIRGIGRGLLYLHQYSGSEIIHGNLMPKNILLDRMMHPKLTEMKLRLREYPVTTTFVHRAIDYMCPDYNLLGILSPKSDVYSFGIVVLEIIAGRRMFQTSRNVEPTYLTAIAWRLWKEGRALELVDKSLVGTFLVEEAQRCIHVALLCIQQRSSDRPTMHLVLKMLEGVVEPLLEPQPPANPFEPQPQLLRLNGLNSSSRGNSHNAILYSDATYGSVDSLAR